MTHTARLYCTFMTVTALLVARPQAATEPHQRQATALDPGVAIERHVALGEEHVYRLTLAEGECATIVVEQRGIDVVGRAHRSGGGQVVEFQEEVRRNGR